MRPDLAAPLRDVDSDVNWPPTSLRVASSQPGSEVVPPEAADPAQACTGNEGPAGGGWPGVKARNQGRPLPGRARGAPGASGWWLGASVSDGAAERHR